MAVAIAVALLAATNGVPAAAQDDPTQPVNEAIWDAFQAIAATGRPEIYAFGARYREDGIDTRLASDVFYNRLYPKYAVSSLHNQDARDVWDAGQGAAILGLFGHSNAGMFMTDDDAKAGDSFLLGQWDSLHNPVDIWSGEPQKPNPRDAFLSQYTAKDVDKMRLVIFAGCWTARTHPYLGSLPAIAARNGVDAAISYPGVVYSPVTSSRNVDPATTNYSGNYYWNRATYYFALGNPIEIALKRAVTDLVAKEGKAWGHDAYRITGSIARPGAVTLIPATWGQPGTASPDAGRYWTPAPGVTPVGSVDQLVKENTSATDSPVGPMTAVSTGEGVHYRLDDQGRLYDLAAPTASGGEVTVTLDEARASAERFVGRHAEGFNSAWQLTDKDTVRHVAGDSLARFTWRPLLGGHPGPRQVIVEVDRRTGAITYYADIRAGGSDADFRISREEAIEAARTAFGVEDGSGEATAVADTWDHSRWVVTIDHGTQTVAGKQLPHVYAAVVDARTGSVGNLSRT